MISVSSLEKEIGFNQTNIITIIKGNMIIIYLKIYYKIW